MSPANIDFEIIQGSDFVRRLVWESVDKQGVRAPIELFGATARMQIRRRHTSPEIELDLEEGGFISIDDPGAGSILINISAEATAALNFRTAVYDIEVEFPGGQVYRIAEGVMALSREVTRENT